MENRDALIVGAGLAGLACAHHLTAAGLEVGVLEAADGPGGRVRTDVVDGFLLDRGFQVFSEAYPEAERLFDYEALDLQRFAPGAAVRLGGAFHKVADPLHRPVTAVHSLFNPVGRLGDKLRIANLVRRARRQDHFSGADTTVAAALADAGFSEQIVDPFFRPFLGGITLDRDLTGSSHVLWFVLDMMSRRPTSLPAAGMGALSRQLADRLPEGTVRYGEPVAELADGGLVLRSGVRLEAPLVVVATDGPAAARLLGKGVEDPGSKPVTCLYFAAEEAPFRGPWLILNGESDELVQNLAVLDEVAPSYAPAGRHLVSATVLGDPRLQEQELIRRVRRQLAGWFGDAVDGWRHLASYRIAHAQPAQPPGFRTRRPASPRVRKGIYLAGDHVEDASINGALLSGRRAAEAVLADR